MVTRKGNYHFQRHSWRAKLLKYLHCRQTLILICTLVVLECMCVMAELMVDLQGIRVRFDNEEEEVHNFLQFMKSNNVSGPEDFNGKSLPDILRLVQNHIKDISGQTNQCKCSCEQESNQQDSANEALNRQKRSDKSENTVFSDDSNNFRPMIKPNKHMWLKPKRKSHITSFTDSKVVKQSPLTVDETRAWTNLGDAREDLLFKILNKAFMKHIASSHKLNKSVSQPNDSQSKQTVVYQRNKRSLEPCDSADVSVFVLSVNMEESGVYIMSHLTNMTGTSVDPVKPSNRYKEHIYRIQTISHAIKYFGFCILTVMLGETLLKIACLGTTFLKKKIEVFDAFIVVASFAIDVVFIDSKWYESGKDATTILVLLLPWRVVRIVNSFMMTLNHKHKIEMVTVRRAKKRTDNKLRKLESLSVEIRRDVELLISLCKLKGANETEIDACIYSKGRGPATLSAITSFASLMFISTLGKDPSQKDDFKDIYGDLVREVLDDEEEDSDTDKADSSDLTNDKGEEDAVPKDKYYVPRSHSAKSKSARKAENSTETKRRATLPRRNGSCDDGDKSVYYINDGYENADESGKMRMYTKRGSKSMPAINKSNNRSNVVTFEVTTQVTYL